MTKLFALPIAAAMLVACAEPDTHDDDVAASSEDLVASSEAVTADEDLSLIASPRAADEAPPMHPSVSIDRCVGTYTCSTPRSKSWTLRLQHDGVRCAFDGYDLHFPPDAPWPPPADENPFADALSRFTLRFAPTAMIDEPAAVCARVTQ